MIDILSVFFSKRASHVSIDSWLLFVYFSSFFCDRVFNLMINKIERRRKCITLHVCENDRLLRTSRREYQYQMISPFYLEWKKCLEWKLCVETKEFLFDFPWEMNYNYTFNHEIYLFNWNIFWQSRKLNELEIILLTYP